MTRGTRRVVVVGIANLDLLVDLADQPERGTTVLSVGYRDQPGGKGLNVACQASASGATTSLVAAIGDDPAGARLIAYARGLGVDLTRVQAVEGAESGFSFALRFGDAEAYAVVLPRANDELRLANLQIEPSDLCVIQGELSPATNAAAIRAALTAGASIALNPSPVFQLDEDLLGATELLVVNEAEFAQYGHDRRSVHEAWPTAPLLVITAGARGALVRFAGELHSLEAIPTSATRAVGAGDAFFGALVAQLASLPSVRDADPEWVINAARVANASAALSLAAENPWDRVPTLEESVQLAQGFYV